MSESLSAVGSAFPFHAREHSGLELRFVRGATAVSVVGSRLLSAVNRGARQGHGVGSLKSGKTMKEVLRRETHRTAVGGD
jgi:hypothetical protein